MRSYFLSVLSRNARPSSMCAVTRGSEYGWSGWCDLPEVVEARVDLDRVDVLGAPLQRDRDVVAAARADDEHVVELVVLDAVVGEVVERVGVAVGPDRGEVRLVREAVHVDEQRAGDLLATAWPRSCSTATSSCPALNVSSASTTRIASPPSTWSDAGHSSHVGASSASMTTTATTPQASGGARRNASAEKPTIPSTLPMRSSL